MSKGAECITDLEIVAFIDNELNKESTERVNSHFVLCQRCNQRKERFKAVDALIRDQIKREMFGDDVERKEFS